MICPRQFALGTITGQTQPTGVVSLPTQCSKPRDQRYLQTFLQVNCLSFTGEMAMHFSVILREKKKNGLWVILRDKNGVWVILRDKNGLWVILRDKNGLWVILRDENGLLVILRDKNGL